MMCYKDNKRKLMIVGGIVAALVLICVIGFFAFGGKSGSDYDSVPVIQQIGTEETSGSSEGPLSFNPNEKGAFLKGVIGGADDCHLAIWAGEGGFSYDFNPGKRVHRSVKVTSFDSSTGHMTMHSVNADNQSGATGDFDGTVTDLGNGKIRYKGVFTNVKGVQINFDISGDILQEQPGDNFGDMWWN